MIFKIIPILICVCVTFTWAAAPVDHVDHIKGTWIDEYGEPFTDLVPGGQEGSDPFPTFICRGRPIGHYYYIPGKLVPSTGKCYMAHGRKEISTPMFKVLVKEPHYDYNWVKAEGTVPPHAIEGGKNSRGDKLFICRTQRLNLRKPGWIGKAKLIGTTEIGGEFCTASWNGKTSLFPEYELLVATEKEKPKEKERKEGVKIKVVIV